MDQQTQLTNKISKLIARINKTLDKVERMRNQTKPDRTDPGDVQGKMFEQGEAVICDADRLEDLAYKAAELNHDSEPFLWSIVTHLNAWWDSDMADQQSLSEYRKDCSLIAPTLK